MRYHWLSLIITDYHLLSLIIWKSEKNMTDSLTQWVADNLKSRDASASKKLTLSKLSTPMLVEVNPGCRVVTASGSCLQSLQRSWLWFTAFYAITMVEMLFLILMFKWWHVECWLQGVTMMAKATWCEVYEFLVVGFLFNWYWFARKNRKTKSGH